MGNQKEMITETAKKIPVVHDVDVVVASVGISGVFVALAAARCGADTVIIDRFGSLGGNMGPGIISGGGFHGPPGAPIFVGFTGIAREFLERYVELGGAVFPSETPMEPPFQEPQYFRDSSIASYLALKMLKDAGVKFMLSTYVAEPILRDKKVSGVFVENKSGRQAVMAKVTIDATGEADLVRRAGGEIRFPEASDSDLDFSHAPTGMGLFFTLGNVNWEKYEGFKSTAQIPAEDVKWAREKLGANLDMYFKTTRHLLPLIRKAWESGEYRIMKEIDGLGHVICGELKPFSCPGSYKGKGDFYESHMASTQVCAGRNLEGRFSETVDAGNAAHISKMEVNVRMYIFETAQFWKTNVPGFEDSNFVITAPYLGARGGPSIEGERTAGSGEEVKPNEAVYGKVPYGILVPKTLDGLIAVGRNVSSIPDTGLRHRPAAMQIGQIGGTAAALSAKKGITPRRVNVRDLRKKLQDTGYSFAEEKV